VSPSVSPTIEHISRRRISNKALQQQGASATRNLAKRNFSKKTLQQENASARQHSLQYHGTSTRRRFSKEKYQQQVASARQNLAMQMARWMAAPLLFVNSVTQDFQTVMERKSDESPVISCLRIYIFQYPQGFFYLEYCILPWHRRRRCLSAREREALWVAILEVAIPCCSWRRRKGASVDQLQTPRRLLRRTRSSTNVTNTI
jgi:hypothetical protein